MTDPRDSEQRPLLAAARAGDEHAFERLVAPYRHALDVHCYRMLGSVQDAEDLVQETLLRAWRALDRFEPRAQFQTWLYRIATNACLDELERRPRRPELIDPFPDRPVSESDVQAHDPAARYASREGMELALVRAIQQLPGRQRPVLIFRDVLGWTAPEVAELLEITVATVNSALQRARATVEKHLARSTPEPEALEPKERELLHRYIEAFERDDVEGLVALLREDAVLRMPPQPSVIGATAVVRFLRETVARGDLSRMLLTPTRANGRPAVAVQRRTPDGGLAPHGVLVLEIARGAVAGIDAFINPSLVPRFASPSGAAWAPSDAPPR
jgi:RNA polymerase sigma-70 factor, ECF subfamily